MIDTPAHNILQEAHELITGPRNKSYGDAIDDFERIAKMWSVILERDISPRQIAMCMICTKLVREAHRADYDNRLDIVGYAALLDQVTKQTPYQMSGHGVPLHGNLPAFPDTRPSK